MNHYERVMAAMHRRQPDRVPVVEFAIDPRVQQAILPAARDIGELAEHIGLDNVGCGALFNKVRDTADGWYDEWGVRYVAGPELLAHPVQGPIRTMDDLATYRPPDPDAPHRLGLLPDFVKRYKGKRAVIFHHRAAFMWSAYLMGLDNLLMAFIEEPELAEGVMDVVVTVNEKIIRNAVRAGADIVTLGDDYAANWGPMFSREHFERLVLPRMGRVVDAIHDEGALAVKHSDGNLWPILDLIVDTGIDGLNPLEPVAGMQMAKAKQMYGDRVCLIGNIDCGELLSHGSIEQVEAAVRQCIADGAEGGGHIVSSSNSIHSSVNPANYVAMVKAVHKWGRYPIQVPAGA